ncbi:MAG: thioredoxin family protein, partial [Melioribacteraceae bacterium]|nr:thioredoxin family protein [Melioribacteraceae bacterium]
MIKIKILGTGCMKCKTLEEKIRSLIDSNEIDAEVEKVTKIDDMLKYGIMMTPGLVVNEIIKSTG